MSQLDIECTREEALRHLLDWRQGNDNFGALIMKMMAKSDHKNFARLTSAFPQHSFIYSEWLNSYKSDDNFFKDLT